MNLNKKIILYFLNPQKDFEWIKQKHDISFYLKVLEKKMNIKQKYELEKRLFKK